MGVFESRNSFYKMEKNDLYPEKYVGKAKVFEDKTPGNKLFFIF